MCLAIPARIESIDNNRMAKVDILGVQREVALDLVPKAQAGDFVLVHAGYAIEIISEEAAEETLALIRDFPELISEDFSQASQGQASPAAQAQTQASQAQEA